MNQLKPGSRPRHEYDVTRANGAVRSGIFVTPDGKIASVRVQPDAALRATLGVGLEARHTAGVSFGVLE
jgi:hypothetical protein